jgi:hypothetical protein
MGEFDQVYKEKEEPEFIYPIYDIEYTNIQGKRAKAFIEKSGVLEFIDKES